MELKLAIVLEQKFTTRKTFLKVSKVSKKEIAS